jgi:phospholipase/carboxylesterase
MDASGEGGTARADVEVEDAAVVWSVAVEERSERLAREPLVIVMHGRGSNENDLPQLWPRLPAGVVYASLRAPIDGTPWGLDGWTWFDLGEPGAPARASVDAAVSAVLAWLDRVEAEFGAPPAIVPMGFSQGGMMSIELLRRAHHRFAAAVDLSGVSGVGETPGDAALAARRPPLFWGHDLDDPLITPEGRERTERFAAGHFEVTDALYPGIGHSISLAELGDVSDFLRAVLPIGGAGTQVV